MGTNLQVLQQYIASLGSTPHPNSGQAAALRLLELGHAPDTWSQYGSAMERKARRWLGSLGLPQGVAVDSHRIDAAVDAATAAVQDDTSWILPAAIAGGAALLLLGRRR